MNTNKLTIKAQESLQNAFTLAQRNGQQAIDPIHILSVLIAEDDSLSSFLLGRIGAKVRSVRSSVEKSVGALPKVSGGDGKIYFSSDTSKLIQRAVESTEKFNDRYASVEHLLLALVVERGIARNLLQQHGVLEKDWSFIIIVLSMIVSPLGLTSFFLSILYKRLKLFKILYTRSKYWLNFIT